MEKTADLVGKGMRNPSAEDLLVEGESKGDEVGFVEEDRFFDVLLFETRDASFFFLCGSELVSPLISASSASSGRVSLLSISASSNLLFHSFSQFSWHASEPAYPGSSSISSSTASKALLSHPPVSSSETFFSVMTTSMLSAVGFRMVASVEDSRNVESRSVITVFKRNDNEFLCRGIYS